MHLQNKFGGHHGNAMGGANGDGGGGGAFRGARSAGGDGAAGKRTGGAAPDAGAGRIDDAVGRADGNSACHRRPEASGGMAAAPPTAFVPRGGSGGRLGSHQHEPGGQHDGSWQRSDPRGHPRREAADPAGAGRKRRARAGDAAGAEQFGAGLDACHGHDHAGVGGSGESGGRVAAHGDRIGRVHHRDDRADGAGRENLCETRRRRCCWACAG